MIINNHLPKIAIGVFVLNSLLMAWVNLAVGIIGNENHPANLMFFGIIIFVYLSAVFSRLKSKIMADCLFIAALAQISAPFIAAAIWHPPVNIGFFMVLAFNLFFVILWFISGLLFLKAAKLKK